MVFIILFLLLLPADLHAEKISEIAELFSVDAFPADPLDHRLLQYSTNANMPLQSTSEMLEPEPRLIDTMSKLLTGTTFYDYWYEFEPGSPPPAADDYVKVSFTKNRENPD